MILIALAMMARKKGGGRKRFAGYIKGNIDKNIDIGLLVGSTVFISIVNDVVVEKTYCSSIRCSYALNEVTPTTGDGPLTIGVAHSDYSTAEIEAWVERSTSWDKADLIGQEVSNRLIRQIGTFPQPDDVEDISVLNDGKPITTKLGWILRTGQTLTFWIYNSGGTMETTSPDVSVKGHANLWER